jgi:hypothetical protein
MPKRTMSSVAMPSMRRSSKRISPLSRTIMLQSARKVVVLPAPLAPSRVTMPPLGTMRSIACSTLVGP